MPVVTSPEMQKMIDRINELHERTQFLADRHGRSYIDELEAMVQLSESMEICRFSYLPGPAGAEMIPVLEIPGQVIKRRRN